MKKFRDIAMFLLIILIVSISLVGITYRYSMSPVSNNNKTKEITIIDGKKIDAIVTMLKKENLIRNPKVFKLYLKMNQIKKLKEGIYKLSERMSSEEIAKKLSGS